METLSVKFGILAGLFGIIGVIGLVVLVGSVIWLFIRVVNFDSVIPAILGILLAIGLSVVGMLKTPTPEVRMEPLEMPWELVLDWIAERRGGEAEDEEPPEKEPEEEAADALSTGAPEQRRNRSRSEG